MQQNTINEVENPDFIPADFKPRQFNGKFSKILLHYNNQYH